MSAFRIQRPPRVEEGAREGASEGVERRERAGGEAAEGGLVRTLRFEAALVGVSLACWLLVLVHHLGLISLADTLSLSLYHLYGVAAIVGWLSGNIYHYRRRRVAPSLHRMLLSIWWFCPLGLPVLLRALAPSAAQASAPLVPLFALVVASIFFAVPMVFRPRD